MSPPRCMSGLVVRFSEAATLHQSENIAGRRRTTRRWRRGGVSLLSLLQFNQQQPGWETLEVVWCWRRNHFLRWSFTVLLFLSFVCLPSSSSSYGEIFLLPAEEKSKEKHLVTHNVWWLDHQWRSSCVCVCVRDIGRRERVTPLSGSGLMMSFTCWRPLPIKSRRRSSEDSLDKNLLTVKVSTKCLNKKLISLRVNPAALG